MEGSDGRVGIVGKGGTLPWGSVGFEGKGGNPVGLGKVGVMPGKFGVVVVCKRWRDDARLKLMLDEKVARRKKAVMKDLHEAMVDELQLARD